MIAWFFKHNWTRRTRWSPLLLSQREFQRAITKERSRADRHGRQFGFIVLRLQSLKAVRSQTLRLAKILHGRLRDTDEKGHLGPGRLGLILPETGAESVDLVLTELIALAKQQGLKIQGEGFVYPDSRKAPRLPLEEELEVEPDFVDQPVSASIAMMAAPYPVWKRMLDILGASVGLLIGGPFIAMAAALVKLTSPGPAFFSQERTGYFGVPFRIHKIRTMVVNAESMQTALLEANDRDGPAFKMRNDPRITTVGRFLRATGIDELPQLFNVLKGDMSLVGPRPLPVSEASQCQSWQRRREEAKPGLTCFWQIAKSRKISFVDWMRLDLEYARRVSLALDLKLIMRTCLSVVLGRVGH